MGALFGQKHKMLYATEPPPAGVGSKKVKMLLSSYFGSDDGFRHLSQHIMTAAGAALKA